MLIVQKYGGSSLADADKILKVAKRIAKRYKEGNRLVIVLSAQGDTTDDLRKKAEEINDRASKRELDMLLATGEQQSVALMAMALQKLKCPAISLNSAQVGIISSSSYSNARIKKIQTERLKTELDRNNIVIVTGFQGVNRYGDYTTLGRGASDTSAVAIAAVLHADICEIYTDVDGIYTADPRIVENATKLSEISYDEMLELANLGANVLHTRAVELAKKYHVEFVVRSSLTNEKGTIVKEETKLESMFVSGVAVDRNVARVSIVGLKDVPGKAFNIFSALAKKKISVDIILQSIGREATKDISFTVSKTDLQETIETLEENKSRIDFDHISHNEDIAKLSIVGAGMATNPGVASLMFEALSDVSVNIDMISTSEIKISVLIDAKDTERAANAVHDKFIGENIRISF